MNVAHWAGRLRRWEIWLVWAAGALGLCAIPVVQGQASIIWDALNHHIYLGWTAENQRFDRDLFAAGWQSYQYPYLYWPAYKVAMSGAGGVAAGVVFALLQSLAIPPTWLVARNVCPGDRPEDIALRCLCVGLAFSGAVTLSLVDTTSNDVLVGIPLIWAVALGLMAADEAPRSPRQRLILVLLSGSAAGAAVGFKLSNGPLALILPALWAWGPGGWRAALTRVVAGGAVTIASFIVFYAPWAWHMWQQFGNPLYPLFEGPFAQLRDFVGWKRP